MPAKASSRYAFGRFILDCDRGALLADGVERALRPKSFVLLRHFAENPGRLVDRDEIMKIVWPSVFVSDDNIAQCIKDIRRALEDDDKLLLRTVQRRGYLFASQVRHEGPPAPPETADAAAPPNPRHGKPSIAVLPFQNMSGDPSQGYFVDGMVEEIITALSRIRWLRVIPRVSSFTYKGQALDLREVGRELGARYLLDGSVRKAGDSLRITGRLIDAETVSHLWIDRFDGSLHDIFDFQDRVASSVAGVIEPALHAAEAARAVAHPTDDLTAYDLYLRGHAVFMAETGKFPSAVRLMEQAIARDPHYGQALSWAAAGLMWLIGDGRSDDPAQDRARAIDYATRALAAAEDDPNILVNAANVLSWFGEDIDAMLALVDRALSINPNFARGWHVGGSLRLRAGDLDGAIAHSEMSLRLSPRSGAGGSTRLIIGAARFFARSFDQALPMLLLATRDDPTDPHPFRYLAACYAHMNRLADARAISERLRALGDVPVPNLSYLRDPVHRSLYQSGLQMAACLAAEPPEALDPMADGAAAAERLGCRHEAEASQIVAIALSQHQRGAGGNQHGRHHGLELAVGHPVEQA